MRPVLGVLLLVACSRLPDLDIKPRLAPDFEERRNERPSEVVAIGVSSRTVFTTLDHPQVVQVVPLTFMMRGVACWSTLGQPSAVELVDDASGRPLDPGQFRLFVRDTVTTNEGAVQAYLARASAQTRALAQLAETPETRRLLGVDDHAHVRGCVAAKYDELTPAEARLAAKSVFGVDAEMSDPTASKEVRTAQVPTSQSVQERTDWVLYFRPSRTGFARNPVLRAPLPRGLPQLIDALGEQQRASLARIDANEEPVVRMELELVCVSSTIRPCYEAGRSYRLRIAPAGQVENRADFRFRASRTSRAYSGLVGFGLTILFLVVQTG